MSTDSTGYAYFSEQNSDLIRNIAWSSPKYASDEAIELYRKQGNGIK